MRQSLRWRKANQLEARAQAPNIGAVGGNRTIEVRLEPAHAGWRLDRALAAAVPTLSRERLKALIRSGAVTAKGNAVQDPADKVKQLADNIRAEVFERDGSADVC